MKLAFVTRGYTKIGGISRCVVELSSRLAKSNEVHIFAHYWDRSPEKSGVVFHRVPFMAGPFFLQVLSFAVWNRRVLAKENFDLVIAPLGDTFGADVIVAHSCHRAWIDLKRKSIAGWLAIILNPLHWVALFLEARMFKTRHYRKIIVVSRRTRDDLKRYYHLPESDIHVIYNGVNIEEFSSEVRKQYRDRIRAALHIAADELLFLFVANEFKRKGLAVLLEAVSLPVKKTSVKLLVIGNDNPRKYKKQACSLAIEKNVIFLGPCADIQKYYAASDCFVLPTVLEPFGLVIAEAMASGLAVITSRGAGAAELIKNGVSGLLVKNPANIGELQDEIFKLIHDTELRHSLGKNAQQTMKNYSWERIAKEYLSVYAEIIKEKSASL